MTHDEVLTLRSAAGSDVGRQRDGNEDSVYATVRLLAVADGMGGHIAGEVASAQATAAMEALDTRFAALGPAEVDLRAELAGGVADAAARLNQRLEEDPKLAGMGSTLTAMLWSGPRFALAHIGDSRCYLLRSGTLTQLTNDHTMAQVLVDQGSIPVELAAQHPGRSVLVRALIAGSSADPDLSLHTAQRDDRYLLCSDGLTDVVAPEQLCEVLSRPLPPDAVVQELIDLANEGGGPDNISCIVAEVVDDHEQHSMSGSQDE